MDPESIESQGKRLSNRRDRLQALKDRRSVVASPPPPPKAPESSGSARMGGGFGTAAGDTGLPGTQANPERARRKILMRVYKMLTATPEDERGRVPDTPFTEAGVARLVEILGQRSTDTSTRGAKVAVRVLNFLQPREGEAATASGVSIAKLQTVARRVEEFRNKGRGANRRRAW